MGLREQWGGLIEAALNEAVDEYLNADELKQKASDLIDQGGDRAKEELNQLIDEKMSGFKEKLKANIIDKIDGEDDIPDV